MRVENKEGKMTLKKECQVVSVNGPIQGGGEWSIKNNESRQI